MVVAALILVFTLLVFSLGKSPIFRVDRAGAAIIGAAITVGTGLLSLEQAEKSVDFGTIVLLFSMMIITTNLKLSGFFAYIKKIILLSVKTKRQLLLAVILISGLLSAFFINDIVCLLFTPVVISLCKDARINPIPYLIAVATASNIGSAGTIIGNPQNILIGSLSGISFTYYLKIAFPLVGLGLILNYLVLVLAYRREDLNDLLTINPQAKNIRHKYLMEKSLATIICVFIGLLVGANATVVASLGAAYLLLTRRLKPNKIYAGIDINLLIIFFGLFVIIGGVESSGLINWLMNSLQQVNLGDFNSFSIVTVLASNIFSNVPTVLLMQFFMPQNANDIWWAGMGVFSTFAGNLTISGSIANLIVAEIAKKNGYTLNFTDYLKIGFPLTVILTAIGLFYFNVLLPLTQYY